VNLTYSYSLTSLPD